LCVLDTHEILVSCPSNATTVYSIKRKIAIIIRSLS
jgi:hypothetical protein